MKVLVSDPVSEEGLAILRADPEMEVVVKTGMKPEELIAAIPEFEGLVVRSETKVTASVIEAAANLEVIARAGVGVDNIDVPVATRRGVVVVNSPFGNTMAAAEHTLALLMAMSRNVPQAHNSLSGGEWKRSKFMGVELYEKVLGIIGLGKIGSEVARRAQAFGMEVIADDPFISPELAQRMNVRLVPLKELLEQSDFITLHLPYKKGDPAVLGKSELAATKDGVRIINVARGGVVDETALAEALKSGKVAGAAIDVFSEEPPKDCPLIGMENVIVTPHLGASTEEAQVKVAVDVCEQVLDVLHGRPARSAVNMPAVRLEVLLELQPYLLLSEKMGKMHAALSQGPISEVEVEYSGEVFEREMGPVTYALLKGVLQPVLEEQVNLVNARMVAESRGIRVVESKSSTTEDYPTLITVKVKSKGGERLIAGTLFGHREPRIVRIDDYRVDFPPEGLLMLTMHHDLPGTIGKVGTILGSHGVNIAGMHVGRAHRGGRAVMALAVDDPIPAEVLAEVRKVPGMEEPRLVEL